MEDIHRYNLEGLKETLDAAAKNRSNAIIGPKEAQQGAEAIKHMLDTPRETSDLRWAWDYPQ